MNIRRQVAVILLSAVLAGCSQKEAEHEAPQSKAAEAESRVRHGTNGEVIVVLDAPAREIMGLRTAGLEKFSVPPGFDAFGRVLDPAPLVALAAEQSTAESASVASAAELARLETLVAQSNASERALESARAAASRDKAQLEAVRLRFATSWGKAIAARNDLAGFVRSLSTMDAALIELNVPGAGPVEELPSGARVLTLGEGTRPVEARFLSVAPSVDRQFQGRGFWFLVEQNQGRLAPGAAVTGTVELQGNPRAGLLLPRDAVVRHAGATWVYAQRSDNSFERVMVRLGAPLREGWFIAADSGAKVTPGDKVVVAGAQQLLSEELKGQEGE